KPPAGIEGKIYRELLRTQPAAQGICTMNSAGKAIAWSLSFDDNESVLKFFAHAKKSFAANPGSGEASERYRRFPSVKLRDVPDNGKAWKLPATHPEGEHCPGERRSPRGSLAGRIVGRAFGKDGKPLSEVRSQDNYVEDTLEISRGMQEELLKASGKAVGRFLIPQALAREFVGNAYLGMLDVNPLGGDRVRAKTIEESIQLWAQKHGDGQLVISGTSRVNAKNREGIVADTGRKWTHLVDLKWHGFIDLGTEGIREIILSARGNEQLNWGGPGSRVSPDAARNPVAHLPSGHSLDISSAVRYGITAK
ncbi:MAG: hypothetical protein VCA55_05705, partial [Verrucomicrobiales bacterium]